MNDSAQFLRKLTDLLDEGGLLRRAMQHEVEDRLSERILHGQLEAGDHITVDAANGEFVFENAPRGEKVAVGVVSNGEISSTPDLAITSD